MSRVVMPQSRQTNKIRSSVVRASELPSPTTMGRGISKHDHMTIASDPSVELSPEEDPSNELG